MRANTLWKEVTANVSVPENSCDRLIVGNPEKEVHRIGITMFPTVHVLRELQEWGADMLIAHEPTFNHPLDAYEPNPVTEAKKKMTDDSGIVIYRYHDHAHCATPDLIYEGFMDALRIDGAFDGRNWYPNKSMTAVELATTIEERLSIPHVRICGKRNAEIRKVTLCLGGPGSIIRLLKRDDVETVVIGEVCEWHECEYVRDCSELGIQKTILTLGHHMSERDGMKLLAKRLIEKYSQLEFQYFESENVYSYTDGC